MKKIYLIVIITTVLAAFHPVSLFADTTDNTCVEFTYSEWSKCIYLDGVQSGINVFLGGYKTRQIISSQPNGCVGGNPIVRQSCGCYECSGWSQCLSGGTQTRTCKKMPLCTEDNVEPAIRQQCYPTPERVPSPLVPAKSFKFETPVTIIPTPVKPTPVAPTCTSTTWEQMPCENGQAIAKEVPKFPEGCKLSGEPLLKIIKCETPAKLEKYYTISKIVDGDTFDVKMDGKNTRVRAIGMDTPEVVDPRKPVQCFGKEASKRAKELLLGKKVRLESDPTQGDKDKYSRLLRYAYRDDGLFFNKVMIEEGFAFEYTYAIPYRYQQDFKEAQTKARESAKGLWNSNSCPTGKQLESAKVAKASHKWYASSFRTSKYYYCETDPAWKGLSKKYLVTFDSEDALRKKFPKYKLHKVCQ